MFKNKINEIRNVTEIIDVKDLMQITGEKNITSKVNYVKWVSRLKRWLYSLGKNIDYQKIANSLVNPSYISLETVLSSYSIIPDASVSYTSVTTKTTKSFKNDFGVFYYYNVKKELYFWYDYVDGIFIAQKEKALLDYFYLKSKDLKLTVYDYKNIENGKYSSKWCKGAFSWFFEERFENLDILDFEILKSYSKNFNKKVYYMTLLLIYFYEENEGKFEVY